jgi:hypothetical protein
MTAALTLEGKKGVPNFLPQMEKIQSKNRKKKKKR